MDQSVAAAVMSRDEGGYEVDSGDEAKERGGEYRVAPAVTSDHNRIIAPLPEQPLAAAIPGSANLRILAVDDDPLVLMNVTALLEDMGHHVTEAQSGKVALEILRSGQHVDLLVTDQSMPGMTGVELAAAARDTVPGIRIVIATGYTELPPANVRFVTLQKPFLDDDIARAIDKAMNGEG